LIRPPVERWEGVVNERSFLGARQAQSGGGVLRAMGGRNADRMWEEQPAVAKNQKLGRRDDGIEIVMSCVVTNQAGGGMLLPTLPIARGVSLNGGEAGGL